MVKHDGRMWGTLTMARTFIANRDCWFQHLKLGAFLSSALPVPTHIR
jgi:hypothetical protein